MTGVLHAISSIKCVTKENKPLISSKKNLWNLKSAASNGTSSTPSSSTSSIKLSHTFSASSVITSPGAESLKTEEQIKILIFKTFPPQFCEWFEECNQSEQTESLQSVTEIMTNVALFSDESDKLRGKKRSNDTEKNNGKNTTSTTRAGAVVVAVVVADVVEEETSVRNHGRIPRQTICVHFTVANTSGKRVLIIRKEKAMKAGDRLFSSKQPAGSTQHTDGNPSPGQS